MTRRRILIRKWSTTTPEMTHGAAMGFHGIAREQIIRVEMPDDWSLSQIYEGFWMNSDKNTVECPVLDRGYWVPPSQVLNIEINE